MIALPYILLALFVVTLMIDTKKAILVSVVIRPIIDCFYEYTYSLAGLRPLEYFGFLLPTLVSIKIIASREHGFQRAPLSSLWMVYIYFQLFGTAVIATVGGDPMLGVNHFYRAFNGFIGFFLFQEFFRTKEEFKALLTAHLVAGLFPLGMSVYQNILGGTIRSEATIGGLVRNIGLYHDAYTLRLYCFQTVAAAILYGNYFRAELLRATRGALTVLSGIAVFTIYRLYSKAGYLVGGMWLLVWHIAKGKFVRLTAITVLLAAAGLVMQDKITATLDTVYSKEVGFMQGQGNSDRLFQGRVGGWKALLAEFAEKPLYLQLVGDGSPHTGAHNDFIRALLGTGVIGLILYLILLGVIGMRCLLRCARDPSPLNILAVMLISMWLIDAMGLVPGSYPGYQVFVWGFIGLAFRGVEGLEPTAAGEAPERSEACETPALA